jgi:hypothetical protein
MGLIYGYDIYLPPRNIARALTGLAALAPVRDALPLHLTLPDGDRLTLPFTSGFKPDPVDCSTGDVSKAELDTSILFDAAADEPLRAYADECGYALTDDGRLQIGYVYLTIRFRSHPHPGYASLEFWAATSRMSRLFEQSAVVRRTFTALTEAAGGVCCLFDTGDGGPERVCWLNGKESTETITGTRFPDLPSLTSTWPDPTG